MNNNQHFWTKQQFLGQDDDSTSFVGIFFYIHKEFKFFLCELKEAEVYGDFIVYPYSHMEIWDKYLAKTYLVDFDYYPRGRIAYNTKSKTFYVYYDKCIGENVKEIGNMLEGQNVSYGFDEHYQCRWCNPFYVLI